MAATRLGRHGRDLSPIFLEFTAGPFAGLVLPLETHEFHIGRAATCDLELDDPHAPILHSVIRHQQGAIWVESLTQSAKLEVNGQPVKRLSLRDGDRVSGEQFAFCVRQQVPVEEMLVEDSPFENLSQFTATELCDRIEAEEQAIAEFEGGRRAGYRALITAATGLFGQSNNPDSASQQDHDGRIDRIMQQIRSLSSALDQQAEAMTNHELELLDAAAKMQSLQERMNQQLDSILDRLEAVQPTKELRAIA